MKALPFQVSIHAAGSLIEQIVQGLQSVVHTGHFAPGERLPNLKAMSVELGVSKNTMCSAIARLVALGVVEARPGAGIHVSPTQQPRFQAHVLYLSHALPTSYYYAARDHTFLDVLREHDIHITTVYVRPRESFLEFPTVRHVLATHPVTLAVLDGESLAHESGLGKLLAAQGVRFVEKWVRTPSSQAVDSVFLDTAPAYRKLARHCSRCGMGRVLFFSAQEKAWIVFRRAAQSLGFQVKRAIIGRKHPVGEGEIGVEREGHSTIRRLLKQGRIEQGSSMLVSTDDYFSRGALTAFLEAGWQIPRDIQFATLVNVGHMPVAEMPLTRIEMYPVRDGEAMAQVVLRNLAPHKRRRKPLVVRPRFVAGRSTLPLGKMKR